LSCPDGIFGTYSVIDATFWAGDLTSIGNGRWRPLIEGCRYLWLEDDSVISRPGAEQ
jgi:hypothetical protein